MPEMGGMGDMSTLFSSMPTYVPIPGKLGCNIDICLGEDEFGDRNCVYLRFSGLVEFRLLTSGFFEEPPTLKLEQDEILATVIGGTGDYRDAI